MLPAESNWTVFKRRLLQIQPRKQSWTKKDNRPLLLPKAQTQTDGGKPSKGFWSQGRKSFWKKRPESVHTFPQRKVYEIRRVIIGILRYVKITSMYPDATSATNVCSGTLRLMGIPVKKLKSGGKGPVPLLKESVQLGCVS